MNNLFKILSIVMIMLSTLFLPMKAEEIIIGTGTVTSTAPFHTSYLDAASYFLYKKIEIDPSATGSGIIKSIAFRVALPTLTVGMSNFKIFMQCTNLTSISSPILTGWTLVYSTPLFTPSDSGWNTFNFLPADYFHYYSTKNLLVKVCFNNASDFGSNSTVYATSVAGTSILRRSGSGSDVDGCVTNMTSSATVTRPNIKIELEKDPYLVTLHPFDVKLVAGTIVPFSSLQHPSVEYKRTATHPTCYITYSINGPKTNSSEVYYATVEGATTRKIPLTGSHATNPITMKFTHAFGDLAHRDTTLITDDEKNTGRLDLSNPLFAVGTYTVTTLFEVDGRTDLTSDSTWEFTVNIEANLVSPNNNAMVVDSVILFKWSKYLFGSNYSIQISNDSIFTNVIYSQMTADTSISIQSLNEFNKYFWRVRAMNSTDTTYWSQVWSFTTRPILLIPQLLAPTNNENKRSNRIVFSWTADSTATSYQLQTSTNNDFSKDLQSYNTNATNYNLPAFIKDKKYYWRVRSMNVRDTSQWSNTSSFNTYKQYRIFACGSNSSGQLGDSTTTNRTSPIQIGTSTNWVSIVSGEEHTLGIRSDGTLWAWGNNGSGQLGDGTTTNRTSPVQIGTSTNWIFITAGYTHSLGVRSDGTLWAWGNNTSGRLGDGTTTNRTSPVQIGTSTNWIYITASFYHTVGIRSDGTLWAWGSNSYGQLGDGTTTNRTSPVQIGTSTNWASIATGAMHTLGIRSDGTLWSWGYNYLGQLGDGTTTSNKSPVQIGTSTNWEYIAAGASHSLGICSDGTLWSWGSNSSGQLGDGTTTNRTSPVQIGTLTNWEYIAVGEYHTLGVHSDGTLWAWGSNETGQLGDGTTTNKLLPTLISTNHPIQKIAAGSEYSFALAPSGFYEPMMLSPQNNNIDITINPTLLWKPVITALSYSLQVATDIGFTNLLVNQNQITDTNFTISNLGYHTQYYWRLMAMSASDTSVWSNIWSFITRPVLLPPLLLTPMNNENKRSNKIVVSWTADSTATNFQLQTSTYKDFSTDLQNIYTNVTSYDLLAFKKDIKYYWRVRSMNVSDTSQWSNTFSFNTYRQFSVFAWGLNSNGQLGDGTTTNRISPVQIDTTTNWISISAGGSHTVGIRIDGTLWAWGYNNNGQLGDGTTTQRTSPVQIGTSTNWVSVVAGGNHTLGIRSDGTLWAWGLNSNSQLGDGTTTQRTSPIQIGTSTNWVFVAASGFHTLGICSDGTLWAWGSNTYGQLGDGTTTQRTIPVQIGTSTNWVSVVTGGYHTLGIRSDGTLWAWGYNIYGQLGDGTTTRRTSPVQIGTSTNWVSVVAGGYHTLSIRSDGTLWAWGHNNYGKLGDSTTTDRTSPVQIGTSTNWVSITAGSEHTLGICGDGTLWAWGRNNFGQLGDGTSTDKLLPTLISTNHPIQRIAAGTSSSVALEASGFHEPWLLSPRNNSFDISLNPTLLWRPVSTALNYSLQVATDISFTNLLINQNQITDTNFTISNLSYHTQYYWRLMAMSVSDTSDWTQVWSFSTRPVLFPPQLLTPTNNENKRSNNNVFSWTADSIATNYQLQISTNIDFSTDLQNYYTNVASYNLPAFLKDKQYYWRVRSMNISDTSQWSNTSSFNTYKLLSLFTWGYNGYGQLGDGTTTNRSSPVQIGTPINWASVAAGQYHSVCIRSDGTLWAWGHNSYGQLGNGTTTQSTSPAQIGTSTNWVSVAAGDYHTVGIRSDGTLWTWGNNSYGQLGDGTTTQRTSPVQIGTFTNWVSVAAGDYHTVGIRSDGTLWAWGWNVYGQLGDGTTTSRTSPVQIGTSTNWVSVAAGEYHTVGIRNDGTLCAWGNNYYGQLGDGTTTYRTSPLQIGTSTNWVSITAGSYHTIGIRSDGTLWAWGYNYYGQLGDSTTTDITSPLQIGSSTNWVSIGAGGSHTLGSRSDGTLWAWGWNNYGQLGDGTTTNKLSPTLISTNYRIQKIVAGYLSSFALTTPSGFYEPMMLSPQNNSIDISLNPTLIWKPVISALSYSLQVATDINFTNLIVNQNQLTDTSFTLSNLGYHTQFYWSLMAKSASDTSDWSEVWSFTTRTVLLKPQLLTPTNNENKRSNNIVFEWTAESIATNYQLQISTNNDFSTDLQNYNTNVASYNLPAFKKDKQYYWRVRSMNVSDTSQWSNTSSFNTNKQFNLFAWGSNSNGQLGDGTTTNRTSPFKIDSSTNWASIAAGQIHTLCIRSDGTLRAWGNNSSGQLGDGTTTNRTSPVQIGTSTNWVSITAGYLHTLGIRNDGTLWAWGNNEYGQLGDGTTTQRTSPVQIGTSTNWVSITAGYLHTLGIRNDGTLWAWGNNSYGQLGDGTTTNRTSPVQIGISANWVSITAGSEHALGIRNDGTLWAWGNNSSGQLGDGTTTNRVSPVQIGTMTNWESITAGGYHTLGIRSDSTLWSWGYNGSGQLGDGTTTQRTYPVQIGTSTNWASIEAGGLHALGIRIDGTLWSWGYNGSGQLGDGTTTNILIPTLISTNHPIQKIEAGSGSSFALIASGFHEPMMLSPLNNSIDISLNSTLIWRTVITDLTYSLQVATDINFTNLIVNQNQITDTSFTITHLGGNTQYYWRLMAMSASDTSDWSQAWSFTTETASSVTQTIPLNSGWNMVSVNVTPQNLVMNSIVSPLGTKIHQIKNVYGQLFAPPFQNSLSLWNTAHAYQVRMNTTETLPIIGTTIVPETSPITLNQIGWYWLPYFRTASMATATALASISGKYLQIKNIQGLVYQPPFTTTLSELAPNAGYMIRMTAIDGTLTYPANPVTKGASNDNTNILEPKVFVRSKNITDKTAFIALDLNNVLYGDEIGVFTRDGMLVGSSVWQEGNHGVVVWGDDEYTTEKDGASEGEELTVKIWSNSTKNIGQVSQISLSDMTDNSQSFRLTYETDAIHLLKGTTELQEDAGLSVSPQPANNELFVNIPYLKDMEYLNQPAQVKIYTQEGKLALEVEASANDGLIKLNTANLSSGVYQLILNINGKTFSEKVVVVK